MAKIDPLYIQPFAINSNQPKKSEKKSSSDKSIFSKLLTTKQQTSNAIESTNGTKDYSLPNSQIDREELDAVMTQIQTLGKQVVESKNYNDILKYRDLVKNFLNFYIKNSLELVTIAPRCNPLFNMNEDKKLIIDIIDSKLEELTINFLAIHTKPLEILKSIELIEGLIIDLQA